MACIKTAIFPVGGLGTRFLPATKSMPKEMMPIVDKPLIQIAFEEAIDSGIEKFIFITGRNKNVIANHFDNAYELQKVLEESAKKEVLSLTKDWLPPAGSIAYVRQQQTLGLGHAVLCARKFVNEPFAVLLADEIFLSKKPVLQQMIDSYHVDKGNIIAVKEVEREKVSSYGVIDPLNSNVGENRSIKLKGIVEKPEPKDAPSNFSVTGRYILQPEIFNYLENQKAGKGGEIQLTDAIATMLKDGQDTYGYNVDARRFDCGNKSGFLEANIAFAMEDESLKDSLREVIKGYI